MNREETYKRLVKIIELTKNIYENRIDPFKIDLNKIVEELAELFPRLKSAEEIGLDIEALYNIALLVKERGEWVKSESSLLVLGPLFAFLRVKLFEPEELAKIFLESWHPIICLNQITTMRLLSALKYWLSLEKYGRKRMEVIRNIGPDKIGFDELKKHGFLSEEGFRDIVLRFSKRIEKMFAERDRIDYWQCIMDKSFSKTVENAYALSFLVSRGIYFIDIEPLSGKIFVYKKMPRKMVSSSIVTTISYEEWLKMRDKYE
ncbi:MAG TPA: hypothetical protein ENG40_02715 [Thermoprotei archaeon]|nr:hypothetical protein [Thermoprotei archaeon]